MCEMTIEGLRRRYPAWKVRGVRDWYKATRMDRDLTGEETYEGFHATLMADTLEELERLLAAQAGLDAARPGR